MERLRKRLSNLLLRVTLHVHEVHGVEQGQGVAGSKQCGSASAGTREFGRELVLELVPHLSPPLGQDCGDHLVSMRIGQRGAKGRPELLVDTKAHRDEVIDPFRERATPDRSQVGCFVDEPVMTLDCCVHER